MLHESDSWKMMNKDIVQIFDGKPDCHKDKTATDKADGHLMTIKSYEI